MLHWAVEKELERHWGPWLVEERAKLRSGFFPGYSLAARVAQPEECAGSCFLSFDIPVMLEHTEKP